MLSKLSYFTITFALCASLSFYAIKAYDNSENKVMIKDSVAFGFVENTIAQIKSNYINPIDDQTLAEGAVSGILESLDPHSAYLSPQNYKEMASSVKGEFGGIGVEIMIDRGQLRVVTPYDGGPAFKAGIQANDIILSINGEDTFKSKEPYAQIAKLRGTPGTIVKLEILRDGYNTLKLNVTRGTVKIVPVTVNTMANGTVAYVKIRNFNSKTAKTLENELINLNKTSSNGGKKLEGIIIDLRWNPGGLLEQAVAVADLFLANENRIVEIKGNSEESTVVYNAQNNDITNDLPIVVLINGGTASAAEILAGALQDNKRAIILGTKSFGKGSVQVIFPLQNGGAMKLTTALYYTPSGHSIQTLGILPDVEVKEAVVVPIGDADKYESMSESKLERHIKKGQELRDNKNASENLENKDNVNENNYEEQKNNDANMLTMRDAVLAEGNENKDFQLMRAIDIIKAMYMLKKS